MHTRARSPPLPRSFPPVSHWPPWTAAVDRPLPHQPPSKLPQLLLVLTSPLTAINSGRSATAGDRRPPPPTTCRGAPLPDPPRLQLTLPLASHTALKLPDPFLAAHDRWSDAAAVLLHRRPPAPIAPPLQAVPPRSRASTGAHRLGDAPTPLHPRRRRSQSPDLAGQTRASLSDHGQGPRVERYKSPGGCL
jgi:hypothetical protein